MSMYNPHRGLGPSPQNARLNELLDGIRAEFESQARASGEYEHSSKYTVEFVGRQNSFPGYGYYTSFNTILRPTS
jgi:hypothetical protein